MSISIPLRRSISGLGATAALILTLSGPASAETGPPVYNTWKTTGAFSLGGSRVPAPRPYNPGPPSYNSAWPGWSPPSAESARAISLGVSTVPAPRPYNPGPPSYNSAWPGWSPPSAANGQGTATGRATDTSQYLQVGFGALGGAVLSGAALTLVARSRRGRLTHA